MKPLKVYAGYIADKDIRLNSSSGAVFSMLARYVFSKQGVVYGVKMSEDCYSAEFTRVEDESGIVMIRGSKYMQAKMGDTFKQVREDLLTGKLVLFSGTGCQVNGLKCYLKKDYGNLLCVDVICHGVPSPALWKKYVKFLETKHGGKIKAVNFRCKDDSWTDFGIKKIIENIPKEYVKKIYSSKDDDPYMRMFLRDYCLRASCYECIAKEVKLSDLTIADFWGIEKVAPEMNDGMGTSLILIRTDKGQKIFDFISNEIKLKEVSYEDGVRENPAEFRSCSRPPQRDIFFNDMCSMSFEDLEAKYASTIQYSFKTRAKRKVESLIKSLLRLFGGG